VRQRVERGDELLEALVDIARLNGYRRQRIQDQLHRDGMDALLLVGPTNLRYLGVSQPVADAMRQHYEAVVAIVTASGEVHVFTGFPEGLEVGSDAVHPPLALEEPEDMPTLARALRDAVPGLRRLGIDEFTGPMLQDLGRLLPGVELADAGLVTGPARLVKSQDEIACIRHAQRINEQAMLDVEAMLRPGIRQTELSAVFLQRAFELGASSSTIDPIWSVTPRSIAAGTITANAEVGFPLASNDRFLREGDLVLCDTGLNWQGYHSDFGKTWLCSSDRTPSSALQGCFDQWVEIIEAVYQTIRPGVTCADLVRSASAVLPKHALRHYYLGHGTGCDAAEPPFIGSDLGLEYDESITLVPGMVFVLEPVVWRDGVGGYRSEEIVAVTEEGFELLTTYGYTPFQGGPQR
jgi:Xaa-Pro dipeptidase